MKDCLIVLAKDPAAVPVKTRLKSVLSARDRRRLYEAFLKDTARLAKKVKCSTRILAYESAGKEPVALKKIFKGFVRIPQEGGSLGERMHNAFCRARELESSRTVLIGSDSPTLPVELVEQAFSGIGRDSIVVGPSLDGGYYLIGLHSPCWNMFQDMAWSSGRVLAQTLKRAQGLKKKVVLLAPGYDVDDSGSLKLLRSELSHLRGRGVASRTRQLLKELDG